MTHSARKGQGGSARPVALLTDPIDAAAAARLAAAADVVHLEDQDLRLAARDAAVIVVRRRIPVEILDQAPGLLALIRHGAGLDFVPVAEASERGIAVVNTPGVNAQSVAEATIGLILAGARRIALKDRHIRDGRWAELRGPAFQEREVAGRRLGILGFGAVGQAIARIAHFGFGMEVIATRRQLARRADATSEASPFVDILDLPSLLQRSDILVLACPLTKETRGLIGRSEIAAMQPGSAIVNIARGAILCEEALCDALDAGHLAFAALDVLSEQPPDPAHPLLASNRVVLSPHTAGITAEAVARMSAVAVEEALRVLAFERPRHLVNPDAWDRIEARWQRCL